jgi:thymidylate synthase (FAD)
MVRSEVRVRFPNDGAASLAQTEIPVLDHGYIKLVDYMGNDVTIVAAARHSYGKSADENDVESNTKLINFLMKHGHTSPFEQPALVFEVRAPLFVFREWHRHRMAKLNEASGRYMELPELFYVPSPERVQAQSKTNKQGSGEVLPEKAVNFFRRSVQMETQAAFAEYRYALSLGVAKELARIILPLNTYSVMVWQSDLSNLLKFLKLRTHETAQWEIRQYASAIERVVEQAFPITYKAWLQHQSGRKQEIGNNQ